MKNIGDKGLSVLERSTLKRIIARVQWLLIAAIDTGTVERILYWVGGLRSKGKRR